MPSRGEKTKMRIRILATELIRPTYDERRRRAASGQMLYPKNTPSTPERPKTGKGGAQKRPVFGRRVYTPA